MATKKSKKPSALDKAKALAAKSKKPDKKGSYPVGQNPPQSKSYSKENDETISAKPVGLRWTKEGAKKLGKKESSRPTFADYEKYKDKTFKVKGNPNPMSEDGSYRYLYAERRADKSDLNRSKKLEDGGTTMVEDTTAGQGFPEFDKGGKTKGGKKKEMELLVNSSYGVYVPAVFVERYDLTHFGISKKDADKFKKELSDPNNDDYWDAWDELMGKAVTKDGSTITQADGDLWLIPKGFEYDDFFKKGGSVKQSEPQNWSGKYNEFVDMERDAKPVGYRYTDKLAKKLGLDPLTKPTLAHINKYYGNGVYWETRLDKSDGSKRLAGGGILKDIEAKKKALIMKAKKRGIYEDFGQKEVRELLDKYGEYNKEIEAFDDWAMNFDNKELSKLKDIEAKKKALIMKAKKRGIYEDFGQKEVRELIDKYDEYDKEIEAFDDWAMNFDNKELSKYAHGGPVVTGSESGFNVPNDAMFAKGGQSRPQSKSYSASRDKQERAKPVGYRYNATGLKRLKIKNPFARPTAEHIEKYPDYVYWENRKDKSDLSPRNKFADGGDIRENINKLVGRKNEEFYFVDSIFKYRDDFMGATGTIVVPVTKDYYEYATSKEGLAERYADAMDWSEYWSELGVEDEDVDDYIWNQYNAGNLTPFEEADNDIEQQMRKIKKYSSSEKYPIFEIVGGGRIFNEKNNFDEVYDETLLKRIEDVESGKFAKGGGVRQSAPQHNWTERGDKEEKAKPVGYRFTDKRAKALGKKNAFGRPTREEIERWLGKGVYWENRKDKSDVNPKNKFEEGGEYARGGSPRISNAEAKTYTENQLPFKANNLDGRVLDNGDYVVMSYGYYPIWYWNKKDNKWHGNKDKYSVTTSKHMSQSRPGYDIPMVSRDEMDKMVLESQEKYTKEWGGDLAAPDFV